MTNFKTKSNRSILHPGEAPPPQGTPVKDRLRAKLAQRQEASMNTQEDYDAMNLYTEALRKLHEYHLHMNKTYGKNPPY